MLDTGKRPGLYRAGEVLPGRTTPGGTDKLGLLDAAGGFHYLDDDGKIAKGKPRELVDVVPVPHTWPGVTGGSAFLHRQADMLCAINEASVDFGAATPVDVAIPSLLDALAIALADVGRMDEPSELGARVVAHTLQEHPERRLFVRFATGRNPVSWADGEQTWIWEDLIDPEPWQPDDPTSAAKPVLSKHRAGTFPPIKHDRAPEPAEPPDEAS